MASPDSNKATSGGGGSGGSSTKKDNRSSSAPPVFPVGPAGRRELRRALISSTDPGETIGQFQQSHSLHTMLSKAFGTISRHEVNDDANKKKPVTRKQEKDAAEDDQNQRPIESLDTDSALTFLSHLGVSQYEIHKRIADTLLKHLEFEIQQQNVTNQNEAPLLDLLKSSWIYATTIPELRPVLWTVLKQLGTKTPIAVLKALAEEEENTGELKHLEIFKPLPPLLKRLVWETDWDTKVETISQEKTKKSSKTKVKTEQELEKSPQEYFDLVSSTLLSKTILPFIEYYCTNEKLMDAANKPFVATVRERRIVTTQRRALTTVGSTTTTAIGGTASTTTTTTTTAATSGNLSPPRGLNALTKAAGGGSVTSPAVVAASATTATADTPVTASAGGTGASASTVMSTGKAISHLRQLLTDTTGGTASASFRPKLLYAILSMLIAKHGTLEVNLMGCANHLHCTLVADLLLSTTTGTPKAYQHVLRLASVLDESVKAGILADTAILKIQTCLKHIFQPEGVADDEDDDKQGATSPATKASSAKKKKKKDTEDTDKDAETAMLLSEPSTAFKRQLNRIISAGLNAMKECDPQNLFLNPVTDAIAPGYSRVIKKPMCIMTMEQKIEKNEYMTVHEWEDDVKLMFKNCIDYNRGAAGQWFRGEAQRQNKVFRDEIFPPAKKHYQIELARRTKAEHEELAATRKRKLADEVGGVDDGNGKTAAASKVVPLPASRKKRKKDAPDHIPSMPALASMLLADPFVVRLLLDRVFRSLRLDVVRGKALPTGHSVIPSLLQMLHMAQWSNQLCAIRGKMFVVPDGGFSPPAKDESGEEDPLAAIPYESLRRFLPLLAQLLLEADLDQRVALGGDLYDANQSMMDSRPSPPSQKFWRSRVAATTAAAKPQAIVCLVEGALVHVCRPGNSHEAALSVTFPKFANALQEASTTLCDDRAFFLCLIQSLLKHKSKLHRSSRDVIVHHWLEFLRLPPNVKRKKQDGSKKKKAKRGTMTSAAHECLMLLLNEWAALGNVLLARDMLLKFALEAVQAADSSEALPERKFSALWQQSSTGKPTSKDNDAAATMNAILVEFEPVRKQYERMLSSLPENARNQWNEQAGIADAVMEDSKDEATTAVQKEEEQGDEKAEETS